MAAGTRTIKIAFDGQTKGLSRATKQGQKQLGSFRSGIKKVAGALIGLFAIKKTFQFFGDAIKDAEAFATAQAITNKVIEQTGGAANVTGKDVDKLTASLARQTGTSDTLIREGSNVLLTFKNLRNEAGEGNKVFDRSNELMLDMSAVFGGDATSNAKILGKALNDPTKGLSALTRVGVTFTDQQKDQIKALQESGDTLGAQKIILDELEGQVGGTAAASANATDKIRVVWEQVRRAIGNLLLPVLDKLAIFFEEKVAPMAEKVKPLAAELKDRVAPAVSAVAGFVQNTLVPALVNLGKFVVQNRDFFLPFVAILGAALVAFKAFMFIKNVIAAVAAFNAVLAANPIVLVIVLIAAIVAAIIYAWKNFQTFRNVVTAVWNGIKTVITTVVNVIKKVIVTYFNTYKAIITAVFNTVKKVVSSVWGGIKSTISGVVGGIKSVVRSGFNLVKTYIVRPIASMASTVKRKIDQVFGFFKSLPGKIGRAFSGLGSAISGPFSSAFSSIKSWWNSTLGGKGFDIPSWVPGVGGKEFRFPRLAAGGTAQRGRTYLVGEQGPELFTPMGQGRVTPNDALGGGDVHVSVEISRKEIEGIAEVTVKKAGKTIKRRVLAGTAVAT